MAWTRTDDLSGEPAEQVSFGFDGKLYTIDLGTANKDKMAKALQPFLTVAVEIGHMPEVPAIAAVPDSVPVSTPPKPAITSKRRRASAARAATPSRRRTSGRRTASKPAAVTPPAAARELPADQRTIRAWANDNNYPVSPKGRIPDRILEKFAQAQAEAKGAAVSV